MPSATGRAPPGSLKTAVIADTLTTIRRAGSKTSCHVASTSRQASPHRVSAKRLRTKSWPAPLPAPCVGGKVAEIDGGVEHLPRYHRVSGEAVELGKPLQDSSGQVATLRRRKRGTGGAEEHSCTARG